MTKQEFIQLVLRHFDFEPTNEQRQALQTLTDFLADREERSAMLLRGAAGTGKTTLSGAVVRTLDSLGQKFMLLAPTGRAAKVFSLNSGHQASTIHRCIYRQKEFEGDFNLNYNAFAYTLFLVDEASMIGTQLLEDLVSYVYSGRGCRLILIGDHAQLPPVGEEWSPALTTSELRMQGLTVHEATLNEVLRQATESGILYNATLIRNYPTLPSASQILPRIQLKNFADLHIISGADFVEHLEQSYREVGIDETIVVTRSNKWAVTYNLGIRNTLLDREEQLERGDMLMIVKNKYLQGNQKMLAAQREQETGNVQEGKVAQAVQGMQKELSFIANGDRARVLRVRKQRELYGFHFADVLLQFPDYDNQELQTVIITDSLTTEAPALTEEQQQQLYEEVMADYADIPRKADRIKALKEDPHYNALQVKYAYAVTCHKAQGGQWAHVYIDQGYMSTGSTASVSPHAHQPSPSEYIHWLYTAFTRATDHLFLVNWPKEQL